MTSTYLKNIALFATTVVLCGFLWGCSKNNTTTTKSTSQNSVQSLFPEVDRTSIITPSGVDSGGGTSLPSGTVDSGQSSTNLQIGNTTRIKAGRYNLEGLIRIKTSSTVALENFSYDGTCNGFKIYLTRSNAPGTQVVPFNLFNRIYNDETFTFTFPSGATINDVDAIAMTCSDKADPVFVTDLE